MKKNQEKIQTLKPPTMTECLFIKPQIQPMVEALAKKHSWLPAVMCGCFFIMCLMYLLDRLYVTAIVFLLAAACCLFAFIKTRWEVKRAKRWLDELNHDDFKVASVIATDIMPLSGIDTCFATLYDSPVQLENGVTLKERYLITSNVSDLMEKLGPHSSCHMLLFSTNDGQGRMLVSTPQDRKA